MVPCTVGSESVRGYSVCQITQCYMPRDLKPRLRSCSFRAVCTRLDDPCTTGSTTLPRQGTSVPGRERPWATAWRFSTGSEFFNWGKNQSRFFLSGAQSACSSLGGRECGMNGTRRLTSATGRVRKVFAFEAGCRRIAASCHRIWGGSVPARHIYSRWKTFLKRF